MSAQSRNTTMVAMTASQARVIIWSAPCLGAPVHARTGRSSWPRLMVGALPGDLEVSGAAGAAAGPHAPVAQCRQGAELQQEGDGEVCPAPGLGWSSVRCSPRNQRGRADRLPGRTAVLPAAGHSRTADKGRRRPGRRSRARRRTGRSLRQPRTSPMIPPPVYGTLRAMTEGALSRVRIAGCKSIRDAEVILGQLNVLVGANGAGKTVGPRHPVGDAA